MRAENYFQMLITAILKIIFINGPNNCIESHKPTKEDLFTCEIPKRMNSWRSKQRPQPQTKFEDSMHTHRGHNTFSKDAIRYSLPTASYVCRTKTKSSFSRNGMTNNIFGTALLLSMRFLWFLWRLQTWTHKIYRYASTCRLLIRLCSSTMR